MPVGGDSAVKPSTIVMHYRHVNQAERYESAELRSSDDSYQATIPARYTQSPFPLQCHFELRPDADLATLHPGFPADLSGQPYFVVRQAAGLLSAG